MAITSTNEQQLFDAEDFGDEYTPELREQEDRLRAQLAGKAGAASAS